MSCNSAIYAINSLGATVAANQIIPLTSVIRRFGNACSLSNYGVKTSSTGYYEINANVTLSPTAAGTINMMLYKDGVQVPGAIATATTTTTSQATQLTLTAIVRQTCCCEPSVYTLVASAQNVVSNAAMTVQKI